MGWKFLRSSNSGTRVKVLSGQAILPPSAGTRCCCVLERLLHGPRPPPWGSKGQKDGFFQVPCQAQQSVFPVTGTSGQAGRARGFDLKSASAPKSLWTVLS